MGLHWTKVSITPTTPNMNARIDVEMRVNLAQREGLRSRVSRSATEILGKKRALIPRETEMSASFRAKGRSTTIFSAFLVANILALIDKFNTIPAAILTAYRETEVKKRYEKPELGIDWGINYPWLVVLYLPIRWPLQDLHIPSHVSTAIETIFSI